MHLLVQTCQRERMTFRQTWSSLEFTFFLVWPNFFRDFISSIALFKPEEGQDDKKKAKKDEKKAEKPAKKQVCTNFGDRRKSCWDTFLVSATPVHGARGDDPVELLQDWLPRGPDQQDPTERTGRSAISKVKENHCKYALDLVLPRCNAEVVIENLFKVFDTQNTGQVKLVKAKTWDPRHIFILNLILIEVLNTQNTDRHGLSQSCCCCTNIWGWSCLAWQYCQVVPTELLMAFSMSMKGSGNQKLWKSVQYSLLLLQLNRNSTGRLNSTTRSARVCFLFTLVSKWSSGWKRRDWSGRNGRDFHVCLHWLNWITEECHIFRKLCKIAQGVEDDQKEIQDKEKEKERELEEKKKEKEEEKEVELMRRKRLFGYSEPVYYSKKMTRWSS